MARELVRQLRDLTKLSPAKRAGAIEALLDDAFDAAGAEKRWRQFQQDTRRLRLIANSLFVYLFVFAPALIWGVGLKLSWPGLLVGLVAFTGSLAWLFRREHLKLYPAAEDERFTQFLTVLLSPATAIRARDMLTRPLLENFHPLTIARVVCAPKQFRSLASAILREIRHPALPLCPLADARAQEAERSWRLLVQNRIEKLLRKSGLDLEELSGPPAPSDSACRSYCPRCLTQFVTEAARCGDCGGLQTVSFNAAMEEKVAWSKP